jgi:hypothetical protein
MRDNQLRCKGNGASASTEQVIIMKNREKLNSVQKMRRLNTRRMNSNRFNHLQCGKHSDKDRSIGISIGSSRRITMKE